MLQQDAVAQDTRPGCAWPVVVAHPLRDVPHWRHARRAFCAGGAWAPCYFLSMQTITLRRFAQSCGLVVWLSLGGPGGASAAEGWIANVANSPAPKVADVVARRYTPLPAGAQQLGGTLGQRFRVNLEGRLLHVDEAGLLDGFRKRPGEHPWIGEHIGKYLDAAARVYRYSHDPRLKAQMDRMAAELIATQKPDGYLGTYDDKERWSSWDVWVHKYDLLGLLAYYETTGDAKALSTARGVGDLLLKTFGEGKRDIIAAGTHVGMAATSVLHPMVQLYRATGDERYLQFCKYILKAYEQPNGPRIVTTLQKTGSVLKTANAKAYEMISNLIGLLKLYEVTGDKTLLNVSLAAWKDISEKRLYLTGSASSKEHFQEAQVLPGEVKHHIAETCVTVNWLEFNRELLELLGEARFGDEIEKTVMNHLLAAQDKHNGNFCYYTPLNGRKPYGPGINCCVSSGPRGISMLPELAWGQLEGAPAVMLYTEGKAAFTVGTPNGPVKVSLQASTDFPRTGNIRVKLVASQPATFPVYLRVPAWTTKFSVSGETSLATPGSFYRIERQWRKNNAFTITMDLPVRFVEGAPSYVGRVAIVRGPQVLAMDAGSGKNPPVALRQSVVVSRLPHQRSPKAALAFQVPARVLTDATDEDNAPNTEITLVPFADARVPQVWLLKPGFGAELAAAKAAAQLARAHLAVRRTKVAPHIDGDPDGNVFTRRLPLSKLVGTGRPRTKTEFDVAWDPQNLYVGVWVTDPTPQVRSDSNATDGVLVGLAPRDFEDALTNAPGFAEARLQPTAKVTMRGGVKTAITPTKDGYTAEFAIPWARLERQAAAGTSFAFELRNHDQGRAGVEDDGDWQWATTDADADISGLLDLVP